VADRPRQRGEDDMSRRSTRFWSALALGLLLPAVFVSTTTAASADRSAPSAPGNLRVTATASYSISLAWTASKDNVGVTAYKVCCANSNSQTVAAPASAMSYTAGVESGRTYTLYAYASDAAGNWSKASNGVTVTTPRDTTPPAKPSVTVTDVGATHVSLSWSSVDNGANLWFMVFRDGLQVLTADRATSKDFGFLQPETTYTFTVQARDFGGNSSPVSDPVVVTTEARDATDTAPPSTPSNLRTFLAGPDGETWLDWDQSTDNVTSQSLIVYEVFINGVFDSAVFGYGRAIVYGPPRSRNTYSIVAVDESGNRSAPATIVVDNF
jgi:chitodextrinase